VLTDFDAAILIADVMLLFFCYGYHYHVIRRLTDIVETLPHDLTLSGVVLSEHFILPIKLGENPHLLGRPFTVVTGGLIKC